MRTSTHKMTKGLTLIVIAALICFWAVNRQSVLPAAQDTDATIIAAPSAAFSAKKQAATDAEPTNSSSTSKPTAIDETQYSTVMGSPQNKAEIEAWFRGRGYDSLKAEIEPYTNYSLETLLALARDGDVKAMLNAAEKLFDIRENEKGRAMLMDAAVHGSTFAFMRMAMRIKIENMSYGVSQEEKKRAAIDYIGWISAAALLGDRRPKAGIGNSFFETTDLSFSKQEMEQMHKRAVEIYSSLQTARYKKGLGDFDNSVPNSVKEYFDRLDPIEPVNALTFNGVPVDIATGAKIERIPTVTETTLIKIDSKALESEEAE